VATKIKKEFSAKQINSFGFCFGLQFQIMFSFQQIYAVSKQAQKTSWAPAIKKLLQLEQTCGSRRL